jgi:hypothetical protein
MLTALFQYSIEQRKNWCRLLDWLTCGPTGTRAGGPPARADRSLGDARSGEDGRAGPRRGARDSHARRTGNIWWQGDGTERNGTDDHATLQMPHYVTWTPNTRLPHAAGSSTTPPRTGRRLPGPVAECDVRSPQCDFAACHDPQQPV